MVDQHMLPPSDDELAAALAAVACYLDQAANQPNTVGPPRSAWRASAVLEAQGLPATRNAADTGWASADRARRAEQWSYGITGL